MSTEQAIDDLMLRWETARQDGKTVSADELCHDCPEFASELRQRIRAVLAMEGVLGVTDHDPNRTFIDEPAGDTTPELPTIPGYEILRIIGHGGMGVVYEARQIELRRTVAIKMISSPHLKPSTLARFRAEAEAAARLQHPNVVQIFEVGQAGGRPFYSMEYIAGGSLADRLARGPYTPHQAAELLESLARTVHAAHEHGIVHRDLKPSNVMMAHDGTPKIADFGLAKRLNDDSGHTNTGEILGTPSYMAPEQAEGKKDQIGPATDVYALGAILYEMLAGQPPFAGITPLEALQRVVHQEPAAPSRFATPVPRDLEAICLKCLEKSPHRRYVSAQALADDLRRFLTGQPVTARHAGPLVRSWKWMRRHPQVVGLAVLIALIAMIPIYYVADAYQAEREVRLRAQARAPLVREILQRNCYECHGQNPKDIQKNFDILNFQQLLDERRRVVVPGAPDNSRLIQRIVDGSMPPEKEEVRLPRVSEIELTILREWIQGGAPPLPEPAPDAEIVSAVPYSKVADETRAIFKKKCYDCHNHKLAERGVKILQHRLLVNVHKEVIPGDPDGSRLFQLVTSDDDDVRMPKAPEDPLTKEEINTIRRWIMAGAPPFPKGR